MISHRACLIERPGGNCFPLGVCVCVTRDSGNHFHAKKTLTSTSAAATMPGTAVPKAYAIEPMNGPMTTPALVAAEIHPSALARSAGAIVSATYACATPVVPPPNPCTMREANNIHRLVASPKMTYAKADALSPMIIAGRRP